MDFIAGESAVGCADVLQGLLLRVGAGLGGTGAVCRLDYSQPGKPPIDWDDPAAKENLVSDLVNDALAVLAELTGPGAPGQDGPAADALGLLALVAGTGPRAGGCSSTGRLWRRCNLNAGLTRSGGAWTLA